MDVEKHNGERLPPTVEPSESLDATSATLKCCVSDTNNGQISGKDQDPEEANLNGDKSSKIVQKDELFQPSSAECSASTDTVKSFPGKPSPLLNAERENASLACQSQNGNLTPTENTNQETLSTKVEEPNHSSFGKVSPEDTSAVVKMVQGNGRGLYTMHKVSPQNIARFFALPAVNHVQSVALALGSNGREAEAVNVLRKEKYPQMENNSENRRIDDVSHSEDDDEDDNDEEFIDEDDNEEWSFDEDDEELKPGRRCPCSFKHSQNESSNKSPLQRQSSNIDAPSTSQLQRNPFSMPSNVVECPDCDQAFDCRVDLNRHRLNHIKQKSFKCSQCDKSFAFSFNLKSHERQHNGVKAYKCAECGLSFMHAFNLHEHKLVHKGRSHFVCRVCLKSFSVEAKYQLHVRRHSSIKSFKCGMCGKAFHRAAGLRAHELLHSVEQEQQRFPCRFCDRTFMLMSHKQMHERVHESEKLFSCNQCGNAFTEIERLKSHVCLQSTVRKFKCDICQETFPTLVQLDSHAKTHIAKLAATRKNQLPQTKFGIFNKKSPLQSAKKRFQCKLCSQGFSKKCLLEEHCKIHQREYTPYMCKECCLTFTHANYLKLHMQTHQRQKTYQCRLCPQRFASKAEGEAHEKSHVDATPAVSKPNSPVQGNSDGAANSFSGAWSPSSSESSPAPLIKIKCEPE
ncbi:uncharacterized protein [Diadema antillarum]|uniref:uncharacterized protein n=1 Tax=Diadema antillarum TaxID=105358 RepID=UPI003A8BFFE4